MSHANDRDGALERADRERALQGKEGLVAAVTEILLRADPIGLSGCPADEYRPEAQLILIAMDEAPVDEASAVRLVHDVFVHMFGPDVAGPKERYSEPAAQIHTLVQRSAVETPR